jgi:SAM-dependent methyltransferase
MTSTDDAWKAWGAADPYFGVATDRKFRREAFASNRDEFFQFGREHIAERLDFIHRIYGDVPRGNALDFGCGVGRLMIPLASAYQHVAGVDISPGMIAEAKRNCAQQAVPNASFFSAIDEAVRAIGPVDLVNSSFVLQHIGIEQGFGIVRALLGALAPGGIAALHLTFDRGYPPAKEAMYQARRLVPGFAAAMNLLRGRKIAEPMMEMNNYPQGRLLRLYRECGLADIICEPQFDDFAIGFVYFGRKAT